MLYHRAAVPERANSLFSCLGVLFTAGVVSFVGPIVVLTVAVASNVYD